MGLPDNVDVSDLSEAARAEVIDLAERLRRREREDDEPRTWEASTAGALADRLADLEADDDPAERQAWLDAFATGATPCRYVPGQGFVPA